MGFYRSLRRKAETWHSLSKSDRALLIRAMFLLPIVATSLKTVGLRRTQSWLGRNGLGPTVPSTEQTRVNVRRAAQMVAVACRRHPLRSSCLPRTIVLWSLLRRRGIDADVRIGVRCDTEGAVKAHAWLEWNGEVLNDAADIARRYVPFDRPAFEQVELQSSCGIE
jgi:transglutaminase-like putative cysteine protease